MTLPLNNQTGQTGESRMEASLTDLGNMLIERINALDEKLSKRITALEDNLSSVKEEITNLKTENWFSKTIGKTDYRPEIQRREPSGDRLIEYRDSFHRYSSPYRR